MRCTRATLRRECPNQLSEIIMSRLIAGVAVLVAVCSSPSLAQLQTSLDVGAGVTAGRGTGMGAGVQAAFELRPATLPLGLRLDGAHHQWHDGFLTASGSYRATVATLSAVYRWPTGIVRPYALAGVGGYALQAEGTKAGWNVGGGLEVQSGRYRLYGEVRTHFVDSHDRQRLTPFVVGLRF